MKKKILILMFALIMVASTIGCSSSDDAEKNNKSANEEETSQKDETGGKVVVDMPSEFIEKDGIYYAPDYPNDGSNVNVYEVKDDLYGVDITQEVFVSSVETTFKQVYNYDVTVEVKEYKKVTIDGYDALRIVISYELAGNKIEQLEYFVQIGNNTTTITYTQTNDADWIQKFEDSAASIKVVSE